MLHRAARLLCHRAGNWFAVWNVLCHATKVLCQSRKLACSVECVVSCGQGAVSEGQEFVCSVECVVSCGQVAVP